MIQVNKNVDLWLIRGDDTDLNITFSGIDLTGATVFFTAKVDIDAVDLTDATGVIKVSTSSHTNPTAGQTTLTITHDDTQSVLPGRYWYDLQIVSATNKVTSIPSRRMEVVPDTTQRVA